MCKNPKCRVKAIELGSCKRCGQTTCLSCGYKNISGIYHDGAFCSKPGVFHETSVDSELRK